MDRNIFQNKKHELMHVLNNVLGQHLLPLFRVYAELVRRADIINHCFTCSMDELAVCLGYDYDDLETILIDLATLNIIDIVIGYTDRSKRTITLYIY